MRILTTGSSGFIGRHFMATLEQGIRCGDLAVIEWSRTLDGDLLASTSRKRVLEVVRPDVVVHLAWLQTGVADYEHDPRNYAWAEATVDFSKEVLQMGSRFLALGSLVEDESGIQTAYADAKRMAALGVLEDGRDTGLTTWLRPSWIFDFNNPRPRVLRSYASARASGKPFVPTHPANELDFIHVCDVARAIRQALQAWPAARWDVASGHAVSVENLLSCFEEWMQRGDEAKGDQELRRTSEEPASSGDRSASTLDWSPQETKRLLGRLWSE